MAMKMLEAGGIEPLTDRLRVSDEDNPGGYYEFEPVKKLMEDAGWLGCAEGKVVKIISRLLYELPGERTYRVIFMERSMEEILASQRRMLKRGGVEEKDELGPLFEKHLEEVRRWLEQQQNFDVLFVQFSAVHADPQGEAERMNGFLEGCFDVASMAAVVEGRLYRQRIVRESEATSCSGESD